MKYAAIILMSLLCFACSHKGTEQAAGELKMLPAVGTGGMAMMPKATAFRMTGDYANNVGVTLNPDGTLAYYPDPTDISSASAPLSLGDGWWLNRQGLSQGSVFTKWTFEEYSALPAPPSREEIVEAIIPGASVDEMITLPITLSDALADPGRCRIYINH